MISTKYYTRATITAILLLLFCFETYAQEFTLSMREVLTIGEETSETTEYMFGNNIRHVQPIAGGNILIADASDNTIRIFDGQGQYLHKFGRRGRGPGEFHEITSVEYDDYGKFFITDRFQGRVTLFSDKGNLIDTKTLPVENLTNLQYVFIDPLSDNLYIGYRNYLGENDDGHFLHLFNSDLTNSQNQFMNVFNHFFDKEIPFEYRISTFPGYMLTKFGKSKIAVTPSIYTGTIAVFDKHRYTETTIGNIQSNFYQIYNWADRNRHRESDKVGFASISGYGEQFFYRSYGYTFALIGNSNFLLQFIGYFEDTIIRPHLKIYSSEGELLTSISLKDDPIPFIRNNRLLSVIPAYVDENNRLYIADMYYQDTYPAVRVFETNLHELLDHE